MKKILIPVDGSEASLKAVKTAVDFALKYESSLTIVTVVREVLGYGTSFGDLPMANTSEIQKINEKNHLNARKLLDKIVQEVIPSDLKVEKKVLNGFDAEEIVREAKAGGYDLIVMGRRGLSKVQRFFIGSVTQRVLAETPCAVYVEKEDT